MKGNLFLANENHADLLFIITCFPDYRKILKKHFLKNKEFRSMCEDYRRCHGALAFWMQPDNKNSVKLQKEYSDLILELEAELIQMLIEQS